MDLASLEPDQEGVYFLPHGTVSFWIDAVKGVLEVSSEPEPHPEDWTLACAFIGQLVVQGSTTHLVDDNCVDVFQIKVEGHIPLAPASLDKEQTPRPPPGGLA